MNRTHEDIQDELLVLRCQDGEADALRALIARWQPKLGRFAWRLTGQRETARDLVQDAWLAIARGIGRLDDPARFRSWAYRIVRNRSVDWIRRRAVPRTAANELHNPAAERVADPSTEASVASETHRLWGELGKLPEEQRAILSLHYLDGMGVAEIARALDVPVGTVKSRLHYARNRLKQAMERTEP